MANGHKIKSQVNSAIYAIVICAVIAGSNGILIKYMTSLSVGAIAWFRTFVPVLFLAPVLFSRSNPFIKGNYKKMLFTSSINAIRMYLFLVAFIFTSIGNAVVLFYSWPIFVSLIEVLFLKKTLKKKHSLLLLLAFFGLIITYADKSFSFDNSDFIGMVAALFAAIGYAVTIVLFKSESQNYNKDQMIVYQNIVGGLVFSPFLLFLPKVELSHLGMGVFYGFLIGVIVFKLFFYGLKQLTASTASSLMYLEVVSAIILGYLVLDERLTTNTLVGGALIVLSSYLITKLNAAQIPPKQTDT